MQRKLTLPYEIQSRIFCTALKFPSAPHSPLSAALIVWCSSVRTNGDIERKKSTGVHPRGQRKEENRSRIKEFHDFPPLTLPFDISSTQFGGGMHLVQRGNGKERRLSFPGGGPAPRKGTFINDVTQYFHYFGPPPPFVTQPISAVCHVLTTSLPPLSSLTSFMDGPKSNNAQMVSPPLLLSGMNEKARRLTFLPVANFGGLLLPPL